MKVAHDSVTPKPRPLATSLARGAIRSRRERRFHERPNRGDRLGESAGIADARLAHETGPLRLLRRVLGGCRRECVRSTSRGPVSECTKHGRCPHEPVAEGLLRSGSDRRDLGPVVGTTARNIVGYVDDALRYGTVTPNGAGYMVEHNLGRVIGTNIAGDAASSIRDFVLDGVIQTAVPF